MEDHDAVTPKRIRHLAQANVARQRAPLDSPVMGEFVVAYLRRRARWFEPIRQPSTVPWWVEADERPTVDEALRRLRYLQARGPSPQAFTLRRRFEPDDRPTRRRTREPALDDGASGGERG